MNKHRIHLVSFSLITLMVFGLLAPITPATAAVLQAAHVKMGHFASFANTIAGTSVTVKVDGNPLLTDFKFGDMTPAYVDLPAGVALAVEIVPTAGGTPLVTQPITLAADAFYTIAFIGDITYQPLALMLLVDDNTRPTSGARVRVAHFAALSGVSAETRLDVCDANNLPLPGLSGIEYRYVSNPYLNLPAGVYHLKVSLAGLCSLLSYPIPPFTLYDYTVLSVFAAGDIVNLQPGVGLRYDQPPIFTFLPIITK